MKILVIAVDLDTFVLEQCNALTEKGIKVFKYRVTGHGVTGYLREIPKLLKTINMCHPDLIHAHYGLSGLLASLQRRTPVITTYHGSDIHSGGWILKLSQLAMQLSAYNIFVSTKMLEMSGYKKINACVQSCGLDLNIIKDIPREQAREQLGFDKKQKIGLF